MPLDSVHAAVRRLATGLIALLPAAAPAGVGPSYGGPQIAGNVTLASPIAQKGSFGDAISVGDFDGDGALDLAVAAPTDASNGTDAGRIDVFLAVDGLDSLSGRFLGSSGSRAGSALAAGDFDDDGIDELAIGMPGASSGVESAGAVVIVKWSELLGNVIAVTDLFQGMPLLGETQEPWDEFGATLAAGDFNGDGFDDLAVGVPAESLGTVETDQGMVHVFYGFPAGLSALGSQTWTQDTTFVPGLADQDDNFGSSLVAADFDANGRDDLAIGAWGDTITLLPGAGSVTVVYGVNDAGLSALNSQVWTIGIDLPGTPEIAARLGTAVAAGDFDCDGYADLALAAPRLDVQGLTDAGRVYVLAGSASRLTAQGVRSFAAADLREGVPGADDQFGSRLLAAHFDGGRCPGLAITSLWGEAAGVSIAGSIDVVSSVPPLGLDESTSSHFDASMLASAPPSTGDFFGAGLAAGDLDGDGDDDLVAGLPGRRLMPGGDAVGLVQLLWSSSRIFGHDFDLGDLDGWSSAVP